MSWVTCAGSAVKLPGFEFHLCFLLVEYMCVNCVHFPHFGVQLGRMYQHHRVVMRITYSNTTKHLEQGLVWNKYHEVFGTIINYPDNIVN